MSEDLYTVEKILAKRTTKEGILQYQVKWVGYPKSQATWEPEENLESVRYLVDEFMNSSQTAAEPKKKKLVKSANVNIDDEKRVNNDDDNVMNDNIEVDNNDINTDFQGLNNDDGDLAVNSGETNQVLTLMNETETEESELKDVIGTNAMNLINSIDTNLLSTMGIGSSNENSTSYQYLQKKNNKKKDDDYFFDMCDINKKNESKPVKQKEKEKEKETLDDNLLFGDHPEVEPSGVVDNKKNKNANTRSKKTLSIVEPVKTNTRESTRNKEKKQVVMDLTEEDEEEANEEEEEAVEEAVDEKKKESPVKKGVKAKVTSKTPLAKEKEVKEKVNTSTSNTNGYHANSNEEKNNKNLGDIEIDVPLKIATAKIKSQKYVKTGEENEVVFTIEWRIRYDGTKPENSNVSSKVLKVRYWDLMLDFYESKLIQSSKKKASTS